MAKPKLKDHHRAFLVGEFACFSGPTDAVEALKLQFGVEITPQAAQHYDPTCPSTVRLAKKWHDLFATVRESFLNNIKERVPEAHAAVRVQDLAKAARKFKQSKNYIAMSAMYEKIARELGGAYTNRRELTGKDGGAIKVHAIEDMTKEQVEDELRGYGIDPDIHRAPIIKQ